MSTTAARTTRRTLAVLAAAGVAAVLAGTASPADAGTTTAHGLPMSAAQQTGSERAAQARITHPGADHAGSTVAAHEGTHGSPAIAADVTQTPGDDVSGYQTGINWNTVYANGARFSYAKATESTSYTNPEFSNEYDGAYRAGLIRGAYHFATPDTSSGTDQADYFVAHGGGWSRDGKTLPPMLDIEYNPYGATCYGLSTSAMVAWIQAFSDEVHAKTSRYPVIYTTTDWWTSCTGNSAAFGSTSPLFIARYSSSVGTLPAGWDYQTIWQYADSGTFPGDQDRFNGDQSRIVALANG